MSYNFTRQELNEMNDWSAKAEQLVRLGLMPVAKLPYVKRALAALKIDAFLPVLIRKPFYEFLDEFLELAMGEPSIYRQIRNKVAANRNDSVTNRFNVKEETVLNELKKTTLQSYRDKAINDKSDADYYAGHITGQQKVKGGNNDNQDYNTFGAERFKSTSINKALRRAEKRGKGIKMANKKIEEERKTEFKKMLRPNFYGDKDASANKTETQKIAKKAAEKALVSKDPVNEANDLEPKKTQKISKPWHGIDTSKIRNRPRPSAKDVPKEKVNEAEEKGGWYEKGLTRPENSPKLTKKQSIQAKRDFIAGAWKRKEEKAAVKESVEQIDLNELDSTTADLAADARAWRAAKATSTDAKRFHLSRMHRNVETSKRKVEDEVWSGKRPKPRPVKNGHVSKTDKNGQHSMKLEQALEEDVNYRKTPQGMLQTLAQMVRTKKRSGGKISANDRKIASKARNELRRRKYFGEGLNTDFLDLADILADEGVFLSEDQLNELSKETLKNYISKTTMNPAAHYMSNHNNKVAERWSAKPAKKAKLHIAINRLTKKKVDENFIYDMKKKLASGKPAPKPTPRKPDDSETHSKKVAALKKVISGMKTEATEDDYRDAAQPVRPKGSSGPKYNERAWEEKKKKWNGFRDQLPEKKKLKESAITDAEDSGEDYPKKTPEMKKVRPSKATWYKSVKDAADTSDVDTKKKPRYESYEVCFAQTLEKFGVRHISELEDEKMKDFLRQVDMQNEEIISANSKKKEVVTDAIRADMEKRRKAKEETMKSAKKELETNPPKVKMFVLPKDYDLDTKKKEQ